MSVPRTVAAVVLAFIVAGAWPDTGPWRPDPVLLVVLAAGFLGGADAGLVTGAGAGLALAPLTLEPFAFDAALLAAAGLAGARAARWFRGDQAAVQVVVAGGMALLLDGVRLTRLELSGADPDALRLLPGLVAGALATAVAAPAVVAAARAADLSGERRRRRAAPV